MFQIAVWAQNEAIQFHSMKVKYSKLPSQGIKVAQITALLL